MQKNLLSEAEDEDEDEIVETNVVPSFAYQKIAHRLNCDAYNERQFQSLFGVDTKLFHALELGIENSIKSSYLMRKRDKLATGYSLSEALILTSINPKYGVQLCIELLDQYRETTVSVHVVDIKLF